MSLLALVGCACCDPLLVFWFRREEEDAEEEYFAPDLRLDPLLLLLLYPTRPWTLPIGSSMLGGGRRLVAGSGEVRRLLRRRGLGG